MQRDEHTMNRRLRIIAVVRAIALMECLLLVGCFSPDPKSLTSDNPASAIPAIKEAASTSDHKAIPRLIADLSENDAAIRFAAIRALQRITGETLDYRYYDEESARAPAIERWKQWLVDHPVK